MPGKMSWFLPENPDVLGTLRRQAAVTMEGMAALVEWADGDPTASDRIRDAEHRADDLKKELRVFSGPPSSPRSGPRTCS